MAIVLTVVSCCTGAALVYFFYKRCTPLWPTRRICYIRTLADTHCCSIDELHHALECALKRTLTHETVRRDIAYLITDGVVEADTATAHVWLTALGRDTARFLPQPGDPLPATTEGRGFRELCGCTTGKAP